MRSAHSEVDSAQGDAALSAALARGVAHAVGALATNIFASCAAWSTPPQGESPGLVLEHLIVAARGAGGGGSGGADASADASAGGASVAFTAGQRHNCALVRLLAELRDALERAPELCGAAFARAEADAGAGGAGGAGGEGAPPPPRSASGSGADGDAARTSEARTVVSCILCTVTFHANHAHNLTRSP